MVVFSTNWTGTTDYCYFCYNNENINKMSRTIRNAILNYWIIMYSWCLVCINILESEMFLNKFSAIFIISKSLVAIKVANYSLQIHRYTYMLNHSQLVAILIWKVDFGDLGIQLLVPSFKVNPFIVYSFLFFFFNSQLNYKIGLSALMTNFEVYLAFTATKCYSKICTLYFYVYMWSLQRL